MRFSKRFINLLKEPNSRFHQVYDFTKLEDIEAFLLWYKLLNHQVAKRTIKGILKNHLINESEQGLFLRMVDDHNSQFAPDPSETEK